MKKTVISILILLTIWIVTLSHSSTDEIDLIWKARALQAAEKLGKFADTEIPAGFSPKRRYELLLEFAYALILKEPDICVKTSNEGRTYHLLFNFGDRGFLDVFYVYDTSTQKLIGSGIDKLPKGKRLFMMNELPGSFSIGDMSDPNEPTYIFNSNDPFTNIVLDL